MMKKITQIILVLCLCISLKGQAQITKIDTFSDKIKNLTAVDRERIETLFFGLSPRFQIQGANSQAEKRPVKIVELNDEYIDQLKNINFSGQFQEAEVISIAYKKGHVLPLTPEHLLQFKNLKYILIRSFDNISVDELKDVLKELFSSSLVSDQIEIISLKMEQES